MNRPSPVIAFVAWFIVGATLAGTVQTLRAQATGGAEGLVFAGEREPAHVVVEEHLPSAPVAEGHGHDGQIFYAIGTDPTAAEIPASVVPPYRYRRVLFAALAGLFGTLDGRALLWGMIVLSAAAAGLAAGATAGVAARLRLPWLTPLAVVLNPGIWLSAVFLTADSLALAFGLLGVWALLHRRDWWAVLALAAAALTKETHIVFALGLAAYLWFEEERRRSVRYLLHPLVPLGAWFAVVALRVGNPLDSGDGIGPPFVGLYRSIPVWGDVSGVELFLTTLTLLGLVLCGVTLVRRRGLFAWLCGPWILVAAVASHFIWDLGNNSIRTLAPIFSLGVVGMLASRNERMSSGNDSKYIPDPINQFP